MISHARILRTAIHGHKCGRFHDEPQGSGEQGAAEKHQAMSIAQPRAYDWQWQTGRRAAICRTKNRVVLRSVRTLRIAQLRGGTFCAPYAPCLKWFRDKRAGKFCTLLITSTMRRRKSVCARSIRLHDPIYGELCVRPEYVQRSRSHHTRKRVLSAPSRSLLIRSCHFSQAQFHIAMVLARIVLLKECIRASLCAFAFCSLWENASRLGIPERWRQYPRPKWG